MKGLKITNLTTGEPFSTLGKAAASVNGTRGGISDALQRAIFAANAEGQSLRTFFYKNIEWKVEEHSPKTVRAQRMSLPQKVIATWERTQGDQHTRIRITALSVKQSPFVVALILRHHGVEKIRRATLEQMFYACRSTSKTA